MGVNDVVKVIEMEVFVDNWGILMKYIFDYLCWDGVW